MPTVAVTTRYSYSRSTLRYRDNRTGQWAKARDVKRAVTRTIRNSQKAMRALAEQLVNRQITLGDWQERFASEIKNLHVSSAMAGAGGMAQMTPADYGRVGARLRFEYERLDRFARQLKAREFREQDFYRRVAMYIASGQASFESARRDGAVAAGYDEERNRLGPAENHCHDNPAKSTLGCVELTQRGWQPIRSMPGPGYRTCISGCKCMMQYRKSGKKPAG